MPNEQSSAAQDAARITKERVGMVQSDGELPRGSVTALIAWVLPPLALIAMLMVSSINAMPG